MKVISFSARLAWREYRGGDLGPLVAALIVAAAALTAVETFANRVELGLKASANELLGGDLVIGSRQPIADEWVQEAQSRGLSTALVTEFPTVVFYRDKSLLVQAKAVSDGYPLRGELLVGHSPANPGVAVKSPPPGSAYLDPRIFGELQAPFGGPLELGDVDVTATGVIRLEPDRSGGVFAVAPRLIFHRDQLPDSGLLGEGSRARYRLLVAGSQDAVKGYRDWLEPRRDGAFFRTIEDSQQQISGALDRAGRFLGLSALSAVLLAGVAIVIAVGQFARRNLDVVAILRTLGLKQRRVLALFAMLLFWVGAPALLAGAAIGYGIQFGLVAALGDLIPESLPGAGAGPVVRAVGTGMLVLIGFGLPPLANLHGVPPVRVLSRAGSEHKVRRYVVYGLPGLAAGALIFWQARDATLAALVLGGMLAALMAFAIVAAVVVLFAGKWRAAAGVGWRYGVANLARRKTAAAMQISGLGLGLAVLFLLAVVQSDLVDSWRSRLPAEAPNYFLINIQPDQVDGVRTALGAGDARTSGVFPLAVSRLVAINGEEPEADNPRGRRRIDGNVNLSWSDALPGSNTITSGEWWTGGPEISLAESWAEPVGVVVGDELTFRIGAREITAPVTSIRKVAWDSFEVNFFVLVSPELAGDAQATWLTSAYIPEGRFDVLSGLVRDYPNISIVDVGTILNRVRSVVDRVSLTVRVVFAFTLAAGIVVLLAVLRAGLGERMFEGAVLRTLGGSRAQLRRAIIAEFGLIGAIAGLIAAGTALGSGWTLAEQVFQLDYQASWWLLPVATLGMALVIAVVGVAGGRRVLSTPPASVFRESLE